MEADAVIKYVGKTVWVESPYAGNRTKSNMEVNVRYAQYVHSYLRQNGITNPILPHLGYYMLPDRSLRRVTGENQIRAERFKPSNPKVWTSYDNWKQHADVIMFFTDLGWTGNGGLKRCWDESPVEKRVIMRIPFLMDDLRERIATSEFADATDELLLIELEKEVELARSKKTLREQEQSDYCMVKTHAVMAAPFTDASFSDEAIDKRNDEQTEADKEEEEETKWNNANKRNHSIDESWIEDGLGDGLGDGMALPADDIHLTCPVGYRFYLNGKCVEQDDNTRYRNHVDAMDRLLDIAHKRSSARLARQQSTLKHARITTQE